MAAGSSTNESRSETRRQALLGDKNKKVVEQSSLFTCACRRTFTSSSGFKRHQKFCLENDKSRKSQSIQAKNSEVSSTDNYAAESEDSVQKDLNEDEMSDASNNGALTDEMLAEVGNLIDQANTLGPEKCHCCGEDLDTAHEGGEFECADCNKRFKLKSSLERHRRVIHLEGETFQCPECEARCPDKGTLARHMYTHTGLKPYSCLRCSKAFSRKYHLERHVLQTGCDGSPKPNHPCQVCGRVFSRKDNLREHLRAHAGQVKRKKKQSCPQCEKEFPSQALLQAHTQRAHACSNSSDQQSRDKPYQCEFCSRCFPSSGAMKKHRRMHTGERPYECKECFAKFAAKETLNRHVKTHTGIKPHICQFCGKSFIQASQLRAHVFHHTGENGFTCEHCHKAFNRRARLLMHVKYVHEGAKPYQCDQCEKTFVRKEDLARHNILHSGIKAHKCPICQKAFAMKSSLKIHLLTHTKVFGWPETSVDQLLEAVIRRCGHAPVGADSQMAYTDRLRENAKLLFTVVIDDSAVKTLLNNQTVDEVILHVLRLAKS